MGLERSKWYTSLSHRNPTAVEGIVALPIAVLDEKTRSHIPVVIVIILSLIERQYSNGGVILNYANGSVKEIYPDGKTSLVVLFNGDTKLTLSDGSVIYTYASEGTVQTTFPDGTEQTVYKEYVLQFKFICSFPYSDKNLKPFRAVFSCCEAVDLPMTLCVDYCDLQPT
ncbi:unnamed protein product [Dibothriocephalus latus]|uniref:Centromere protein J C-terminal domain-containing protein n=1 Tax=Dibothriocephalus latus TaxID=60516 RepID=A0A3P7MS67_DIBLA|nr:unnamed protein product [Dibothriocephalus latus]